MVTQHARRPWYVYGTVTCCDVCAHISSLQMHMWFGLSVHKVLVMPQRDDWDCNADFGPMQGHDAAGKLVVQEQART